MALTADQLIKAAALNPTQFDPDIVSPESDEETQREELVAYLESDVLPGANAEVSVPFRRVTGYGTIEAFVAGRLSGLSSEERAVLVAEGNALWDAAAKSYGRSELNKIVDSNATQYDRDSDQDRIQGNQRLEKLLEWAQIVATSADDTGIPSDTTSPASRNLDIEVAW